MSVTVKNVYKDKAAIGRIEDCGELVTIIHHSIPGVKATDNCDRTISLTSEQGYEEYRKMFDKSILKWCAKSKIKLNCPPAHSYNAFQLSPQHILIRV